MNKDVIIALINSVMTAPTGAYLEPMPLPVKLPDEIDWDEVYKIARIQHVDQIVGYALRYDICDDGIQQFLDSVEWAIMLEGTIFFETNALFSAFDREEIDYCPINGIVTKKFYPLSWMRTMDDVDILIKDKDLKKAERISAELGYEKSDANDCAAAFNSASLVYKLELHTKIHNQKNFAKNSDDIWQNLEKVNRYSRRYEMTNIAQFLYILKRCNKHLNDGGIKLISLLDFLLLHKELGLDEGYAREAVQNAGLLDLYITLEGISSAWFNFGALSPVQQKFLDDIFESRAQRTSTNPIADALGKFMGAFRKR